jgi:sensor histidine kinase regulating citrate/malate metabolism
MVREIRSSQHEFDNHLNTLLNMHVTIDNYEELVEQQSSYINEIRHDVRRKLIPLLRISDKVLAGFLYSKIVAVEDWIQVELQVKDSEILSGTSEHDLIEVLGTLFDNAVEACTKERNVIRMSLDSEEGHLIFDIENPVETMTIGDTGHFFERGYSSKKAEVTGQGPEGCRGYGLYNAKHIVERHGGSITVSLPWYEDRQFIHFHLVL